MRERYFNVMAFTVALAILAAISFTQGRMNAIIVDKKLTDTDPVDNAPPVVAFTTVALGGFRGLLADILWLRTMALQDEGKYFEMVQLASWITQLQPRFTGATAYLAWNMAYNISVTCNQPEDRWKWVNRGLELIRDQALAYNSGDPTLYKELGWIYQHKLGGVMDDANFYYKNQMALTYTKVFGCADPNWRELAAAPKTLAAFKNELGSGNELWARVANSEYGDMTGLDKAFRINGRLPVEFADKLSPSDAKALEMFLRSKWLRETYKLDPETILEINRKYGRLDWRVPESHAIYWAELGLKHAPDNVDIHCERMISQCLKNSFMAGRVLLVDDKNFASTITVPNMNVGEAVRKIYLDSYNEHGTPSFKAAYNYFMIDAIVIMYTYGDYSKAKEFLRDMKERYPTNKRYKKSLDEFVLTQFKEDVKDKTMEQTMNLVSGLLFRTCYYFAYGDTTAAAAHLALAKKIYTMYQKYQIEMDNVKRLALPPFSVMKDRITRNCLDSFAPALAKNLEAAIADEKAAAEENNAN